MRADALDTLGLAAFTVIGAKVALLAGLGWVWIPFCAALTCAGGAHAARHRRPGASRAPSRASPTRRSRSSAACLTLLALNIAGLVSSIRRGSSRPPSSPPWRWCSTRPHAGRDARLALLPAGQVRRRFDFAGGMRSVSCVESQGASRSAAMKATASSAVSSASRIHRHPRDSAHGRDRRALTRAHGRSAPITCMPSAAHGVRCCTDHR